MTTVGCGSNIQCMWCPHLQLDCGCKDVDDDDDGGGGVDDDGVAAGGGRGIISNKC